jgi:hypothetical protein
MVKLKTYIFATRPWSFSMTFISVTVGSLFGLYEDAFHWLLYVVVLLGTVFAHGATNLMNDYFDVKHGLDQPGSPTSQYRPHPLVEGSLKGRTVFTAAALLYALAFAAGIYLATVRGWTIAVLAVVGALAGYFYTADPVKYKYLALGEFSVFLMWGPLMVGGSFYVQTGSWVRMPQVILASIPFGPVGSPRPLCQQPEGHRFRPGKICPNPRYSSGQTKGPSPVHHPALGDLCRWRNGSRPGDSAPLVSPLSRFDPPGSPSDPHAEAGRRNST